MSSYTVTAKVQTVVEVKVEARNQEEALDKARAKLRTNGKSPINSDSWEVKKKK
jgi:hypothetical protein